MNQNPLYYDTVILAQRLATEEAGIQLTNHHGSIFAVGHIYNALRKLGLTDIVWPDMERIIQIHTKSLLAGDVPSTSEEIRARAMFRLGFNRDAERYRHDLQTWKKKYMAVSKTSTLISELFRTKQPLLNDVMHQLQEHVEQKHSTTIKPGRKGMQAAN